MGFNETGYSGTRISRLVISLVVNIAYSAWSGAVFVPDEGAARMGLKVLLEGLDLLIIMDFFSIDLNGALKTTSTNTKPTRSPGSGQTDKVLSTQLVGSTA
ncbi:hypothetical protein BKA69DRAFT_1128773 [Paraphysoderma sedebokerense]|nr:hypothetical protein BKA69DRAFT_1128773 [Paraphysoderma sedebokerense]